MKMMLTPDDQYLLSLASCDFEELSLTVADRLRAAGFREVAGALRKNARALTGKIWNLEVTASPPRDRRIHEARMLVAKCAANLTAGGLCLPSETELWRGARRLLLKVAGTDDR